MSILFDMLARMDLLVLLLLLLLLLFTFVWFFRMTLQKRFCVGILHGKNIFPTTMKVKDRPFEVPKHNDLRRSKATKQTSRSNKQRHNNSNNNNNNITTKTKTKGQSIVSTTVRHKSNKTKPINQDNKIKR